jgi:hypothetical protein
MRYQNNLKISIIIFILINCLPLQALAISTCSGDDILSQLESLVDAMDSGSCACNGSGTNYDYFVAGEYCGTTALADAKAANGGSQNTIYKGTVLGLANNADAGYVYEIGNSYVEEIKTCAFPYPRTDTYSHTCYKVPVYTFANCSDCTIQETCYFVLKTFACPNGQGVGIEYQACSCLEQIPISNPVRCGNADLMTAMENAEHDGTINENLNPQCLYSDEDIMAWCSVLSQDCEDDDDPECENDEDCDGIDDNHDQCPGTAPGIAVDAFGCPLPSEKDTDDDGIPDSDDECPDTAPGAAVNPDGCEIDNPQPDPNESGGDQDNDNALLEGIIEWLKQSVGIEKEQNKNLKDIESAVNDSKSKLTDIKNALTEKEELTNDESLKEDEQLGYDKIQEVLDDQTEYFSNNPLSDASFSASGPCSMSISIPYAGSVTLSICEYQEQFQLLGNALYGISCLFFALYLFRS